MKIAIDFSNGRYTILSNRYTPNGNRGLDIAPEVWDAYQKFLEQDRAWQEFLQSINSICFMEEVEKLRIHRAQEAENSTT